MVSLARQRYGRGLFLLSVLFALLRKVEAHPAFTSNKVRGPLWAESGWDDVQSSTVWESAWSQARRLDGTPSPSPSEASSLCGYSGNDTAAADEESCATDSNDTSAWNETYIDHCRIVTIADGTSDNDVIVKTLSTVASSLGIVGGVWTLVTYCVIPEVQNPSILIEVQLAIANLLLNGKSLLDGNFDVYDVSTCCPTDACYVTAAIDNFAALAAIIWSGCITTQAYLLIVLRTTPKVMDQTYKFFYIVGWGVPTVFTIWPLIGGYFGPAGHVCWIPSIKVWQQVVFYYGWLFIIDVQIAVMLTHIGFAVRGTKSSGAITRFIAYAVWAVVTTFGFMVHRSREWANPCTETPFALTAWNAFFFPAQGLGYSVIFTINANVHQGWKNRFQRKSSDIEEKKPKTVSVVGVELSEKEGVDGADEDSKHSPSLADAGYSSDEDD